MQFKQTTLTTTLQQWNKQWPVSE